MDPKFPGNGDFRKSNKFFFTRIFCEYFRKNKFLSKTILACLSGAQMASIHEIKKWQKIS